MIPNQVITKITLILCASLFIVGTGNLSFFTAIIDTYGSTGNSLFMLSLAAFLFGTIVLLSGLLNLILPARIVITLFLLISAASSYFMDTFSTIIDEGMIVNITQTDMAESSDLISSAFLLRILLLFALPCTFVWFFSLKKTPHLRSFLSALTTAILGLLIIAASALPFTDKYTVFFREYKAIRYHANPVYPIYAAAQLAIDTFSTPVSEEFITVARHVTKQHNLGKPRLLIFVVGETVRAANFSLNGYSDNNTTPQLSQETNLINYSKIQACGTATATSVPCMFSFSNREQFNRAKAPYTENVLDVLQRADVNVLWRDNNSSSKGVADRLPYEDFTLPENNPVCDIETRDIGMLSGLQDYVDHHSGDTIIVLHQKGSHGPAYHKRYPKEFEKFTPVCYSSDLSTCTSKEIINAYDNSVLYTDYFLSQVIRFLENNSSPYQTSMLYVSDHGESLGEKGIYLHGAPYMIAPDMQKHVPLVFWSDPSSNIDYKNSLKLKDQPNSHDAITLTLLQIFSIESDVYDKLKGIKSLIHIRKQ
ncbi:putative phosphatidylethanolamine transferase Mcr-1 [invertebrate metagenome]|uniref:Putative phosphatidylethanolamine transferase Mcr-1 n=1 Tax=invertebrate metagenome TaxID=1711999 RepID=A0A2H9TAQ8_9ZZZZ